MKRILLFAASALAAVTIQAKVVTTQQAQSFAKQFRQTQAARSGIASTLAETDMKLAYAPQGSEYYVFNGAGNTGYVIVSGDDCAPTILGYGNTGSFDISNKPPAMKAWLDIYAKQVAASAKSGIKYTASTTADHEKIEPLMTTKWNQLSPYNDLCPFDETQGEYALTGCVATAMAQVANYHKWPERAKGIGKATFNQNPVERDMNGDVFDWNNMLNEYVNENGTEIYGTTNQRAAVALLMVDMGYSVGMNYSVQVSGVGDLYVPGALIDHFDYDKATHIEYKNWYTEQEWDNIIYNELANKRPIVMGGDLAEGGGHEFVCDGYAGGGYYHFNWGWGGECDDNFLLSALNPGSYNFNSNVSAIIGVQKPQEGSDYVWQLGNWSTIHTSVDPNTNEVSIVADMCNLSAKPFSGQIGLKVVNTATNEVAYKAVNTENLEVSWEVESFPDALLSGLSDGVYKISTAFKPNDGEWTESRYFANLDHEKELKLTVEGGKRSYAVDAPLKVDFYIDNIQLVKDRSTELDLQIWTNGVKTSGKTYYTIVDNTTNSTLHTSESQPLEIDVDNSTPTIKVTIPAINDIDATHDYDFRLFFEGKSEPLGILMAKVVETPDPSGIQGTKDTAATAVTTEVYNMQGMRLTQHSGNINISGLPSGFYIIKTTDNIGNTKTSKVMVKTNWTAYD